MNWTLEYFEDVDETRPAEVFEDGLFITQPLLAGKLRRLALALETYGTQLKGGYLRACSDYPGLWELRVVQEQLHCSELLGFDDQMIVLLHGYTAVSQRIFNQSAISITARNLQKAYGYWQTYHVSHRVRLRKPRGEHP